jgi:hypothetical protein
MHKAKQKRLEKKGWRIGSADEFLDLSPEEEAFKPLLNFVWRHRFEFQALMGLNACKKT